MRETDRTVVEGDSRHRQSQDGKPGNQYSSSGVKVRFTVTESGREVWDKSEARINMSQRVLLSYAKGNFQESKSH